MFLPPLLRSIYSEPAKPVQIVRTITIWTDMCKPISSRAAVLETTEYCRWEIRRLTDSVYTDRYYVYTEWNVCIEREEEKSEEAAQGALQGIWNELWTTQIWSSWSLKE